MPPLGPLYWAVPSKAFGRSCVAGTAERGMLEAPGLVPGSGGRDPSRVCCHGMSEARGPGEGDSGAGFPRLPKLEASHTWACLGEEG